MVWEPDVGDTRAATENDLRAAGFLRMPTLVKLPKREIE